MAALGMISLLELWCSRFVSVLGEEIHLAA